MVIKQISKLVLERGTAVILPIYQGEQLLEELETLTKELSASISRRKMMEQVDPETGEVVEEQKENNVHFEWK